MKTVSHVPPTLKYLSYNHLTRDILGTVFLSRPTSHFNIIINTYLGWFNYLYLCFSDNNDNYDKRSSNFKKSKWLKKKRRAST